MSESEESLQELNHLLKENWDRIADDYYTDAHRTSRNFDAVIALYLPHYLKRTSIQSCGWRHILKHAQKE
jgi:hypothetical protein